MNQPLVSVIIPVYNTGESAVKLVDFLTKNPYSNIEIICIDDGSKDDSLKLLKEYKRQFGVLNSKIKLLVCSQKNGGAAAARNTGIEKASGKYLIFIDSDDFVDKNFISKLVKKVEKEQLDLVATGYLYNRIYLGTRKNAMLNDIIPCLPGEEKTESILRLILKDGKLYATINKIFKAENIRKYNIRFDEERNFAEDLIFVLDYLKASSGKIGFILEPLYIYNYGTETSTVAGSSLMWKNWKASFKYLKGWVGDEVSRKSKIYLTRILIKWKLAHSLAVARSQKNLVEKCKLTNPILLMMATMAKKIRS